MGRWHPESPQRLDAINDQLLSSGLASYLAQRQARLATDEDILRVHDRAYLQKLKEQVPRQGYFNIDPDTLMNPHTLEAAYAAAGAGLDAVDGVMTEDATGAFCAVRPPGHHAERARAMGFCFFNNIAVAAAYAMEKYDLKRVLIVDFDVHHGNGTEQIFAGDERVLMCGFFQSPFFPDSFQDPAAQNMVNIPVEAYTKSAQIIDLFKQVCLPRIEAFAPEIVFFSAGFDAHREDEMGQLSLVEADYAELTAMVVRACAPSAGHRLVSMLEGGYDPSSLGRSVVAHIKALAGL
ncbi:histone deacetylase family protein [Alcaligenes faecalis subsp. faecalis NCIB 8687]|jgi:acetoin utilization deacetylase AcuC-like enzyme|nr:histone deacetylase family protein [Alcaligenes faecalis subsp. faecalis NCIB 8687]